MRNYNSVRRVWGVCGITTPYVGCAELRNYNSGCRVCGGVAPQEICAGGWGTAGGRVVGTANRNNGTPSVSPIAENEGHEERTPDNSTEERTMHPPIRRA